ncbi:D-alanyl-D-alanine carboxypeptidase/D-alanyl-D-alanine-endopeptidase [Thalassobacter stenotrophicus]|uniref:D-alanyl-D-alanine carboxypeptidase/D-alanyl-D-alanine endopeptidase n=1 Tax=Thalassobacter stenotrophicus TaxID=266809 RepID=UPI0022A90D19|nr:D-alanyl-D-alanine carboxypeptidase/D-alanyl-D-alanine-endopeptidase [Thalassobacter stenotrophicus]UYP68158.1 D-alanyl-D-alanine carboxypeptidase/D-alanyl-D-alanine-endopeptidase [Thalassobacter stenotrophicus]
MDRRFFLHGLFASVAGPALANSPAQSVRPVMRPDGALPSAQELVRASKLSGQTSLVFSDLKDGRILASSSPRRALPPASVAKALTALYGLERLGPEFRFETRLGYAGTLVDGRLEGDLVLLGGGDPTLATDDLAYLAAQAKAAGLREVTGRLLVWGGHLPQSDMIDASQPDHVGYNPAVSGMNLNFNRVHFEWQAAQSGYEISLQARTARYRPSVQTIAMDVVDRSAPVFAYRDMPEQEQWSVARGALGKKGGRWLPVRVPIAYAADVMTTLLRSHGIVANGYAEATSVPSIDVLSTVQSRPLEEICADMLKYSTNLTAECVGLAASGASSLRQSAEAMSAWVEQEFGARRMDLVDHSGLGDVSRVAARDVVKVLASDKAQNRLRPILKPFKLRDGDDPESYDVKAKTGTLNFVSGLAGYADVPGDSERSVAFAIFSADLPTRGRLSKAERERPPGGRAWSRRARVLQSRLIRRFGAAK